MSSITTDKGILHYEVLGRGDPVIFLHGWLGSWALWKDVMTSIASRHRAYALDFWGFGESGRKRDSYQMEDFVDLIYQFMDQLGIESAPLIGHSMGGTVSLLTGLRHPDSVSKIIVVGSPIKGSSLALPLKLAGEKRIASFLYSNINIFRFFMKLYAPIICKDARFPGLIDQDIMNSTVDSFLKSIADLRHTDLTIEMQTIQMPILGLYGTKDNIVAATEWKTLKNSAPHAKIQLFPRSGHFVMLDQPQRCTESILEFLQKE
ncbi:MAG: hypothetical protein BGO78_03530 [Chloroflexi bacterium 44-23]|nr:MAG: hypothetical protein BGO78_03530 [Chloroflexi bacterium 44-23]